MPGENKNRLVLLVCDECKHFFHEGKRSSEPHRPAEWEQTVASLGDPGQLLTAARAAGCQSDDSVPARWSCPDCLAKSPQGV